MALLRDQVQTQVHVGMPGMDSPRFEIGCTVDQVIFVLTNLA